MSLGGGQGVPKGGVSVSEGLRRSPEVLRKSQLIQGSLKGIWEGFSVSPGVSGGSQRCSGCPG